MTDRKQMDRPAMAFTFVLGVVLVGASLPFTIQEWPKDPRWNVSWSEDPAGSASAPLSTDGAPVTVQVTATDALVADAIFELTCTDTTGALGQPAQVDWSIEDDDGNVLGGGTDVACAAAEHEVHVVPMPERSSVRAPDEAEGAKEVYAGLDNATVTYTLTVSWSRPDGQVPPLGLPVGAPTLVGEAKLTVNRWVAEVSEDEEVPR